MTCASLLATAVIITFFVTSSDSCLLVIDMITAGGNPSPPVAQRFFWAVTEGVVAAVLLVGRGLPALQTAAVATGLPFAILLLVMSTSLYRGLLGEPIAADPEVPGLNPALRGLISPPDPAFSCTFHTV